MNFNLAIALDVANSASLDYIKLQPDTVLKALKLLSETISEMEERRLRKEKALQGSNMEVHRLRRIINSFGEYFGEEA